MQVVEGVTQGRLLYIRGMQSGDASIWQRHTADLRLVYTTSHSIHKHCDN